MNVIPENPESASQLGNDHELGATLKKANHVPNTTDNVSDVQTKYLPLRREQSSVGHRERPSLAMRLSRTKQNLFQKASALSCTGQQDALATPHNVLEMSGAKPGAVRGRSPTDPDITAEEQKLAEVALIDIGSAVAPEKLRPASGKRATRTYHRAICFTQCFLDDDSASMTGTRESVLRRRPSFRTLAYDPSVPLVYLGEAEQVIANNSAQTLQSPGLMLSGSKAERVPDVSHGSRSSVQKAHPKPNSTSNVLNTALIETSSPISLSNLDSSAFNTALKLQASAKNDSQPPSNSNSLNTTLLIHSDAIFLPSAITAKTSSAVPSSDRKRTGTGSTSSQIAQILRAVDADRDRLEAQHAVMMEALREAEREKVEYREFIAGLMQSHREREERLLSMIAELQGEYDRKSGEVERLREVVAGKVEVEEKLE